MMEKIRQGIKSSVETVPMPVRLEVEQLRLLKILAALEGTTASAILRECVAQRIKDAATTNIAFKAALKSFR